VVCACALCHADQVPTPTDLLATARRLADELLFPAALDVDAADLVPRSHLDALAAAGLCGLWGPVDSGGLGADPATGTRVVEVLAGGCLATTFVLMQHQGVVRQVAAASDEIRDEWLAPLCRGDRRSGVAIAGIRPGADPLRARRSSRGWTLHGSVPWVTGWGLIDVVHVAALDDEGDVVWLLVDAGRGPSVRVARQRLVACDASGTVTVSFEGHDVARQRRTSTQSYGDWQRADTDSLRGNGSLALGVAGRCAALLGSADLVAEIDGARARLDAAGAEEMPAARAAASELCWRAAAELAVVAGGRAVLRDQHAQRLVREALFLLVFGSRPSIKSELRSRIARPGRLSTAPPAGHFIVKTPGWGLDRPTG
jgi:alkylation response protein AidB-like acyl-CoA dehydrogenase